jgi:1-acyl-sn-glycerol-3-phosphate acyltransferase
VIRVVTRLRAYIGAVVNILSTLFFSTVVLFAGLLNQQHLATWMIRGWARFLLWTFGVRIVVEGAENLPLRGGGILVFNHQSHLDIPTIVAAAADAQIRFGAKIELFKIPVFGIALKSIGTLQIARDNRTEVLRIYREAAKRFEDNILFVLAPEGTRQHQAKLGRFKKGPFLFAMNAKVPLIPVVLKGAFEVLPPKRMMVNLDRWHRTIYVRFLPAVDSARFTNETLDLFVSETSAQMTAVFESLPTAERTS